MCDESDGINKSGTTADAKATDQEKKKEKKDNIE
jgi:hypothetical protein